MHLDNILKQNANKKAGEELHEILLDIREASEPLRVLLAQNNLSLYVDINCGPKPIQTGIPFAQVMGYDDYRRPENSGWGKVLRQLLADHYEKGAAQEFYNTATK